MHGGEIYSIITRTRQYSWDLPNCGMHIPCKYRFIGDSDELKTIAYSEDPQNVTHDQDNLRVHLLDCFTKRIWSYFLDINKP